MDLGSARHWARDLQARWAVPGARCVDATMGGGFDTEALASRVGDSGHVYAFDVQSLALDMTRARLQAAGLSHRVTLIHSGHEHMSAHVIGPVDLAVFNLGWLPGSPDKRITTRVDTTLFALDAALSLLRPGGLITVCAYPGHDEGASELAAVLDWARALPPTTAQSLVNRYLNAPANAPVMIAIAKSPRGGSRG